MGLNILSTILSFNSPFDNYPRAFRNGSMRSEIASRDASESTLFISQIMISLICNGIPVAVSDPSA